MNCFIHGGISFAIYGPDLDANGRLAEKYPRVTIIGSGMKSGNVVYRSEAVISDACFYKDGLTQEAFDELRYKITNSL